MTKPLFDHFDLHALLRTLDALECVNGHYGASFTGLERSTSGDIKYAKLFCSKCGDHIVVNGSPYFYMPMPALPAKQKKQRRTAHLPTLGSDFCWICNWDAPTLLNFGMSIHQAHPIDRAAAIDSRRDPMDDRTFPLCSYHHRWVDNERAQYAKMRALLQAAGAVALDPTGIERPMLIDIPPDPA